MNGNIREAINSDQIVDRVSDSVIIIEKMRIIFANRSARLLMTGSADVSVAKALFPQFLDTRSAIEFNRKATLLSQDAKDDPSIQLTFHASDGVTRFAEGCIHLEDQNASAIMLILNDRFEQKAIESRMLQSSKLSIIGELSAGIIHEIKNPLTAIKGFLQLMEKEQVMNRTYLAIILREVNNIEKISGELLYFAKPEAHRFEPQNLKEIAGEAIHLFESQATQKNIRLIIQFDNTLHQIMGDRTQLKQMFINLIKNAIEASYDNSKIRIRLKSDGTDETITVQNHGQTIPENMLNHLGQSFMTTKETGTGLGLMVTCTIVRNHHGKITVESNEESGTLFTLTFPQAH
jgi:Signal transduction histidine kinase, nitrogen specific